jgi:hypothetical protein
VLRLALVLPCLTHVMPRIARVAPSALLRLGGTAVVPNSGVTMRMHFVMVRLSHVHVRIVALLTRVGFRSLLKHAEPFPCSLQ